MKKAIVFIGWTCFALMAIGCALFWIALVRWLLN